jgi:selenide,water dikinase
LGQIPSYTNPDLLVGYDAADEAGEFRIDAERALVQTLGFFTPIVDEPHTQRRSKPDIPVWSRRVEV